MNPVFRFCAVLCAVCLLCAVPARAADFVMSSTADGYRVVLPGSWTSLSREQSAGMAAAAASGVVSQAHMEAVAKLGKGARKKRIPVENTAFFTIVSAPYPQTVLDAEALDVILNEPDAALAEVLRGMNSVAKSHPGAVITASKQDRRRALLCYSAAMNAAKTDKKTNVCITMRPAQTRFFIMMAQYDGPWDAALQDEVINAMERARIEGPASSRPPRDTARPVKRRK